MALTIKNFVIESLKTFYEKLINDAVDVISKYGDFEWFVSDDPYISKGPDWMRIPNTLEEELPFN